MVRLEDQGVSQMPSPSQSQRACKVARGSESVDEEASNDTELFTLGYGGGKGNPGAGPVGAPPRARAAARGTLPGAPGSQALGRAPAARPPAPPVSRERPPPAGV